MRPSPRTWAEVRHLLWLQGRLIRSSLRGSSRQDLLRLIGLGLLALMLVPGVLAFNAMLVWVYRALEPQAAAELVAIIFSSLVLFWLLSPASNQQLVEPFDLPKLFPYPISLPGLIAGSLVVNVFGLGLLSMVPFALAVVVGLPRSLVSVVPVLLSSLLFLTSLVILKAIIDDVFDLIAEDRRLRSLALMLALLPVILIVGGQLWLQASLMPNGQEPSFDFQSVADLNQIIIDYGISRYLIWQPGGWIGRAAGAAATGAYLQWAWWTGLLLIFVAAGFVAHYAMLRRLYFGELVRVKAGPQTGSQALRQTGVRLPLVAASTSEAFLGLVRADWRSFTRNPYTLRMAIAPVMLGLMAVFFGQMMPGPAAAVSGLISATAVLVLTLSYGHNVFGILDNPGLATVLLAPVRPRLLLFSHNLLLTIVVLLLAGGASLLVAVLQKDLWALPAGLGAALALHLPMLGLGNLTSVYFPYKVDLEKGRAAANESRTSLFAVLAAMGGATVLALPAVALVLVPFFLWKPGVVAGAGLALLYLIALYGGLSYAAGQALERRGEQIVAAISEGV